MRISDWSSDVCSSDLQAAAALRAGQEDAAFLERLADRGDPEREVVVVEAVAAGCHRADTRVAVGGVDRAPWKHERSRGEVDLMVAHHHEDLQARRAVAEQEDRRCRPHRRYGLVRLHARPRFRCPAETSTAIARTGEAPGTPMATRTAPPRESGHCRPTHGRPATRRPAPPPPPPTNP